jgi:hypothetical protein
MRVIALLLAAVLWCGNVLAAVPQALNYQGYLTNPVTGAPLNAPPGSPLTFTIKLWDALTAGNLIYSEAQSVTVTNGVFNVGIGSGTMQSPPGVAFTAVPFDQPYWLELVIGGETIAPRQPIRATPYAIQTLNAQQLGGLPANRFVATTPNGYVGLGTSTPLHRLGLAAGPQWTTNGWSGTLDLENASALGWRANGAGNHFGMGQSWGGLYFFHTSDEPGTVNSPAYYDLMISDIGNVGIGGTVAPNSRLTVVGIPGSAFPTISASAGNNSVAFSATAGTNGAAILATAPQYGGLAGHFVGDVHIDGILTAGIDVGGTTPVCIHSASNGYVTLAICQSSLRYKEDLQPFHGGLDVVKHLQPRTFRWKSDSSEDLGFIAEEVAQVEPFLVTHNAKGEIEGVKYDRMSTVFVNAFKEQQARIERQQLEIAALTVEAESLKAQVAAILAKLSQ